MARWWVFVMHFFSTLKKLIWRIEVTYKLACNRPINQFSFIPEFSTHFPIFHTFPSSFLFLHWPENNQKFSNILPWYHLFCPLLVFPYKKWSENYHTPPRLTHDQEFPVAQLVKRCGQLEGGGDTPMKGIVPLLPVRNLTRTLMGGLGYWYMDLYTRISN